MVATAEAVRDEHVVAEHVPHKKLVIMAWSGDLDRIWPTLILGTTGAAMGMETTIFFTFWGLFPLVRDDVRITGDNWMQKLLATMDCPGLEHVRLGKMNFGRGARDDAEARTGAPRRQPGRAGVPGEGPRCEARPVPDDDGPAGTAPGRPDRGSRARRPAPRRW